MTIICGNSMLMLSFIPLLGAMRSIDVDQETPNVKEQTVDFGDLNWSASTFNISHGQDKDGGSLCNMKWEYKNLPERIIEELDIRIHLEADVKAFTYIDAQSFVWCVHRDLIIKENDDELVVKAFAYDPALDGWRYPTMKVGAIGTESRTRAENMLLKDGNFSPLGHLKGVALDPLIKSINWDSDSDKLKCEKIYHFLAFKAPEGYENGDLDWLFDFVKANTDRVVKVIRMWKKEH